MRLEIGNFKVTQILFGDTTAFSKGVLTIHKDEALKVVREDEHITSASLHIVAPGDMVRLCPVKEAMEMRCKIEGGTTNFPGSAGPLEPAGNSRVHALKRASLIVVGEHWGGFQDGLLDMGGKFQRNTLFGSLHNLVLVADSDEEFERHEQQKKNKALRWAGMRLAEYVGSCLKDLTPEKTEVFKLPPLAERSEEVRKLPSVVCVLQPQTQMEAMGYNTLVYGWDGNHMLPTFMHPNEILDGAVISGSFMPCSSKWSTYQWQTMPILKKLINEAHGKTLNFLGVIMSNLNVAMEQKQRSAQMLAQMAANLGADGAFVVEEGYGNPDVDFIQAIVELEKVGVKTVGITNECTGRDGASQPLVALDELADAIVSCGNVSQYLEMPPMPKVLGELEALARDGSSGGWEGCVHPDGSLVMENNGLFCSDGVDGSSLKTCKEF